MTRPAAVRFEPAYPPLTGEEPCIEQGDPELWFSLDAGEREFAKTKCRACPLVRACLAWALAHEAEGVWGATDADERSALRRKHGIGFTRPEARAGTLARPAPQHASTADFDDSED